MLSIGPYQVLDEIARGGMGVVYRARRPDNREQVAIKVLLGARGGTVLQRKRFEREALTLLKLDHPNIVRIHEWGDHEGLPYLVMDFVAGENLQERIERGEALAPPLAAWLTRRLALALDRVHEQGMLHRDVKPANIIVTPGGEPLLTDFGLARDLDPEVSRLSTTGQFMGTPGYWPPEQSVGDLNEIGPRSDVYSLGATLYAMLTLEPPIRAATLAEIVVATRELVPDPPSHLNPDVDPTLEAICLRCLDKDPASRWTAGDLAFELERYLAGDRLGATPARRRRGPVWIVFALGLLTVAGVWLFGQASRASVRNAEEAATRADAIVLLQRGVAAFSRDDPEAARALLTHATELDPKLATAYVNLASAHLVLGDFASGQEACAQATRLDPGLARPHVVSGLILEEQGEVERAEQAFDRAIRLDPRNRQAWQRRAYTRSLLGREEEALADVARALQVSPNYAKAFNVRAVIHFTQGRYELALADLTRALEVDPGSSSRWVNRGRTRQELDDPRGAIADFDQALRLDGRNASAFLGRAVARRSLDDDAGALEDLDRALALEPDDPLALARRGNLHLSQRRYGRAIEDYTRALRLDSRDPVVLLSRGSARRDMGDLGGAVTDYTRAIELQPDDPESYSRRAGAYARLGQHERVIEDYTRILELDPGWLAAWIGRAVARQGLGQHEAAVADCTQVLALAPDSGAAFATRASSRVSLGDVAGAIEDFEAAQRLLPPHDPNVSVIKQALEQLRHR